MIIGTAGHVDHGKTRLVRALTGVDTDRLHEEKQRGISIELGYAYLPLPNGEVLGFVDVPGHERLVHTMAAGACGIDFALLVVAADDGVMPQTCEHVAILQLLGVSRGAVALTKLDRVSAQRVRDVESQIRELLRLTQFSDAPIFPVNATVAGDRGTAALQQYLQNKAMNMPARDSTGLFRLAVDRVFTLAGHGTVVAGTVFSGNIRVGDTALAMPGDFPLRVRSIHAQNRPSECGLAGQRCALNVSGIEKSSISRGSWLGDPRALISTKRIDVRLRLFPNTSLRSATWSTVHVHMGAGHCLAHLALLDPQQLTPGDAAIAQLVLESPMCALSGDRFIVRDAQAAHTIGGGVILDPSAPSRKRRSEQRLRYLDAIERMLGGGGLGQVLAVSPHGLSVSELEHLTGHAAADLDLPPDAVTKGTGHERFVLLTSTWHALRQQTLSTLSRFHTEFRNDPGPDAGRLRRITQPDMPPTLWHTLVDELASERALIRNGPWLQLPEHTIALSESDCELARQLQMLIAQGRPEPPWVRDLAATVHQPEERVRRILREQAGRGAVCQIVHDLFYDSDRIDALANVAAALARDHDGVDAARYRDAIGLGRKRTIQILEFFDRVGYTRRVHDMHVLRKDSGWIARSRPPY